MPSGRKSPPKGLDARFKSPIKQAISPYVKKTAKVDLSSGNTSKSVNKCVEEEKTYTRHSIGGTGQGNSSQGGATNMYKVASQFKLN